MEALKETMKKCTTSTLTLLQQHIWDKNSFPLVMCLLHQFMLSMYLLLPLLMSGSLILEPLTTWPRIKTCFQIYMFVTRNIYVGDDISVSVVGSRIIHLDNCQFKDVLCVPTLSYNFLSMYQINHSGEGKTIKFTPNQVVIKDLNDPIYALATRIIDDITR